MKRLSLKEEKIIFSDRKNLENIKNLRKILDYFYMNDDSHKYVLSKLYKSKLNKDDLYLDKLLKLNNQRRAIFTINESIKSTDKIYEYYRDMIPYYISHSRELRLRKTFDKKSVTINNQPRKLFKYLLSKNIVTKSTVDRINMLSKPKEMLLLISRNPIDYMFLSTNQNFTSCMDMKNNNNYFFGITGAFVDPNRFLVALIKKDGVTHYTTCKKEFSHFKYITRTWGLLLVRSDKEEFLHIVNTYPSDEDTDDIIDILRDIYKIEVDSSYNNSKSKFAFKLPRMIDSDCLMYPYIDSIPLKRIKPEMYMYGSSYCGIESSEIDLDDFDFLFGDLTKEEFIKELEY